MNILFISYDSYKYDGRLRELIKVAQELGEVTFITRDEGEEPISGQHILYKGSGYLKFISFCAKQAKKMQDVDAIFIDNRKGILPGYLAKRLTGAIYVIQDCRELYDMKSAAGRTLHRYLCDLQCIAAQGNTSGSAHLCGCSMLCRCDAGEP